MGTRVHSGMILGQQWEGFMICLAPEVVYIDMGIPSTSTVVMATRR